MTCGIAHDYTVTAHPDRTVITSPEGHAIEVDPAIKWTEIHVIAEAHWKGMEAGRKEKASADTKLMRRVADLVRTKGAELQAAAGHEGRMSDGGGRALVAEAAAFAAGLDGRLPAGWEIYAEEARRKADPEYAEYQRLRQKFGGR